MIKQEGKHQEVVDKEDEEVDEEIHQGEEVEATFIEVQVWKKIQKNAEFVKEEIILRMIVGSEGNQNVINVRIFATSKRIAKSKAMIKLIF